MSKTCTECKESKSVTNYHKDKSCKSTGMVARCKLCISKRSKKRYIVNKDKILLQNKVWRSSNKDKLNELTSKWKNKHRALCNHREAQRRSNKLNATPKWLTEFDLDYIYSIYIQAKELSKINNEKYEVDHIIPLKGKTVCGLHVPWNLQVLTKSKNAAKGNRFE